MGKEKFLVRSENCPVSTQYFVVGTRKRQTTKCISACGGNDSTGNPHVAYVKPSNVVSYEPFMKCHL